MKTTTTKKKQRKREQLEIGRKEQQRGKTMFKAHRGPLLLLEGPIAQKAQTVKELLRLLSFTPEL
jgi:hypothetical protein